MGSSLPEVVGAACCLALVGTGCSVGVGEGEVTGQVWASECGLEGDAFDLNPNFFAADPQVDGADVLQIRVQKGSDSPLVSDGLFVQVTAASEVHAMLGTPIDLAPTGSDGLVSMTLYLNDTCPFRVGDPNDTPVALVATEGTITFDAIYAPDADEDTGKRTEAHFDDVTLTEDESPDDRRAVLSGEFSFIFSRGRPAQPFP